MPDDPLHTGKYDPAALDADRTILGAHLDELYNNWELTTGGGSISHAQTTPTFTVRDTYQQVLITNNSPHRLIINNIDVANKTDVPQVELDADSVNLLFPGVSNDLQPRHAERHGTPADKAFFPSFRDYPGQYCFYTSNRIVRLVRRQRRHVALWRLNEATRRR